MSENSEKTPEWLVLLENKKKRHNRLAHEIGAGAPCLSCGDSCPGLDLHFWRKLCRNCKCKKEEHDVKDDEGYEQFEILLGPASKKRTRGACLNITVPEIENNAKNLKSKEVAFDWIPPNVTDDVAVEYMKQLPTAKLPISGSDGALYRRQQLERQVPIHDLDASRCHNLTPQEVEGLKKYLENLKSNVVGQGRVTKVPLFHAEVKWLPGESSHKSLPASHSADSIRGIPPLPFSAPRPFHPASTHFPCDAYDDFPPPPPPLPNTLPPSLKKPSNFVPTWKPYHNPDAQTAYSEAVLGQPSFASSEHQRMGVTAANQIAQRSHSENLGDAAYQKYGSVHDESTADMPVDGTISRTLLQRNTLVSTSLPGVSSAMKVASLLKKSTASDDIAKDPLFCTNNATIPHMGTIVGSHYPSEEQYSKAQQGQLMYSNPLQRRNLTDVPQERNLVHPAKEGNNLRQQPRVILHSDTINVKNSTPGTDLTHFEEPNTFHRQKSYYSAEPVEGASDTPFGFTAAAADTRVVTNPSNVAIEASAGLKSFLPGMAVPTRHTLDEARNNVRRQQTRAADSSANTSSEAFGMTEPLAAKSAFYSSLVPHGETIFSEGVPTDALPKSALAIQQLRYERDAAELAGHIAEMKMDDALSMPQPQFDCKECRGTILAGDVAVFADRAGQGAAWHPSCFVCTTCKELLVDLIYFFNKGNVYCGRHYAELLKIPRCFACDELIFVNEYTMAEEQAFHVKHFCCYECDTPLGGKKYIPVDDQPVCLDCFQEKYGKNCHACGKKIDAGEQRVSWKDLHWHVRGGCFGCFACHKSLLGGSFVVKKNQPFCSKECVFAAGAV